MNWIRINNKLPDEYEEVLFRNRKGAYFVGYIYKDGDVYFAKDDNESYFFYITHWSYIEPPIDKE
jgi:hypothetical protein